MVDSDFGAFKLCWLPGDALGNGIYKLCTLLYGCVDNLHIVLRISKAVAHLTSERAYFALSATVLTGSPGTRHMIVKALQGDRNCHMWVVTKLIRWKY